MATPTFDIAADLALIGMQFVATIERCGCASCHALDTRFDADAIAVGPAGRPCFVAWRAQPDYDYTTITIREVTDRGGGDSQVRKMLDGRSKADLYLQSYPSGIVWALASAVREGLASAAPCAAHQTTMLGSGGQLFRVLCASCCNGITYVRRASTTAVESVEAVVQFEPDDDFLAAWDAIDPTSHTSA